MLRIGLDIGGTSVKAALLERDAVVALALHPHDRDDRASLVAAIHNAIADLGVPQVVAASVGVAVPGVVGGEGRVVRAVNVPGLEGLDLRGTVAAVRPATASVHVIADAQAAGLGWWLETRAGGRVLALVMGTGVGGCLLENGLPVPPEKGGPRHLGQIDVGPCGEDVIGPDGGRNGLEGYVGLPALRARLGDDIAAGMLTPAFDPVVAAVARAIRICLVLFRPDQVVLLGGVGMLFRAISPQLEGVIRRELSRVVAPAWCLSFGGSRHYGAVGAAWAAGWAAQNLLAGHGG